jgi:tetratricopeptide (TPR) repeat protein
VEVAKLADPDPWRNQLRDTLTQAMTDRGRSLESLKRLAATADPERLPEASVARLAFALAILNNRDLSIDLLRRAQRVHPDDFWLNADLARLLSQAGHPEEAVRYYSVALAIRPKSNMALFFLAEALTASGHPDEAKAYSRLLPPRPHTPRPRHGPPPPPKPDTSNHPTHPRS